MPCRPLPLLPEGILRAWHREARSPSRVAVRDGCPRAGPRRRSELWPWRWRRECCPGSLRRPVLTVLRSCGPCAGQVPELVLGLECLRGRERCSRLGDAPRRWPDPGPLLSRCERSSVVDGKRSRKVGARFPPLSVVMTPELVIRRHSVGRRTGKLGESEGQIPVRV